jgi:hypothetical protein
MKVVLADVTIYCALCFNFKELVVVALLAVSGSQQRMVPEHSQNVASRR